MRYFDNVSIRNRLIFAFILWILIFIGFGTFAVIQMDKLGQVTKGIYDAPMRVSNAATEARVGILTINRDMKNVILAQSNAEFTEEYVKISPTEKMIIHNLDTITEFTLREDNKRLADEAREIMRQWGQSRVKVVEYVLKGDTNEAARISKYVNEQYVLQLDEILKKVSENAFEKAWELVNNAASIEKSQNQIMISLIVVLAIMSLIFLAFMVKSIVGPINSLKAAMTMSAEKGEFIELDLRGNNEIIDMANHYKILISKLKNLFWIKDRQNLLNDELSGQMSLSEFTGRAINFLSRLVDAGNGVFYLYNEEKRVLSVSASFAYSDKDQLSRLYALGEGIVGQVALERKPILLSNIRDSKQTIRTGLFKEPPLNTVTFPLVHEESLYGVIELSSFEPFDQVKKDFINEAARIISIKLYAAIQNHKVKKLFDETETAGKEAQKSAAELKKANEMLLEHQSMMEKKTRELQDANAGLEEQQQMLQQQSEEMMQTNLQLEEQQQLMEEQTRLLNEQNAELDKTSTELMNRTKDLEISNRYKSEFLANMSHELRTPLNSIILLSKLLLKNENQVMGRKELDKVDVINKSGQELLRLINDVMDLTKIESGKVDMHITTFHSRSLIEEMKQFFEVEAKEKGLEFVVEDYLNMELKGDRDKLSQVLRNLLSNAFKFTEKGVVTLKLMKDDDNGIVFAVSDTGIGLSGDQIPAIFEEFRQGDGSTSRKYGGTGLGLSISKKLAELMDGEIRVKSEVEVGSTFSLHLYDFFKKDYVRRIKEYGDIHEEEIASIDEVEFKPTSDKVILVIEDSEIFSEHLRESIESMGFDALIARNGRTGLNMAKKYKIDGILLDIGLPDMSGIEVMKELKRSEKMRNIPVHIISVNDKDNRLQRMGAIGYLKKSEDEKAVEEVISKLIAFSEKKPKYLLVIDDNPAQINLIKVLLGETEVVIVGVETEEAARLELEKGIYDAGILNLELKYGNALGVCRYAADMRIEVPIIVFTGKELTIEQEKEIRKYADSIVIKSASSNERLLDEVTLFLHRMNKDTKGNKYLYSGAKESYAMNLDGKRILIVDDDPRNIYTLAAALENYGAEIIEAENGKVALEILKEKKTDLVLMDIMMPVMDGFEAIKAIRNEESIKHIPIIALTAKTLKEDMQKCIEVGANDYISKPVDYDILVRLVKAWINK